MELPRPLRSGVVIALAYTMVALPLLVLARAHGAAAMLWASSGLLLGWLLRRDARAVPSALVLCLLADVIARLMAGSPPLTGIGLAVADLLEVAVAWALLHRWWLQNIDAAAEPGVLIALGLAALGFRSLAEAIGEGRRALRRRFVGIVAAALLAFSLSFDDFIITNFVSGNETTFPKFVYVSYLRGIPAQANVIGFSMFVLAVLLVIGAQVVSSLRASRVKE